MGPGTGVGSHDRLLHQGCDGAVPISSVAVDQLVLDEAVVHVKAEQAVTVSKLEKVEAVERAVHWLLGAVSLFVIGYYVLSAVSQFKS